MGSSEILCLVGSTFHILSIFSLTSYCAKLPWDDNDSELVGDNKDTCACNQNSACDGSRPHGGMYSDYWWGSRFVTTAIFGVFSLIFLLLSSVFQSYGLMSFSPKSRWFKIQLASGFLSISAFLTLISVAVYTSIVPYNNKYAEDNNFKLYDCKLNYLYWNSEWYQIQGWFAFLFQVFTAIFYQFAKVAKWKEIASE